MNSREKIMEATRQAMQEWKEAHAGAEFADMDSRLAYINSRVMELTTEEIREAAETGEDAIEETETEETTETAEQVEETETEPASPSAPSANEETAAPAEEQTTETTNTNDTKSEEEQTMNTNTKKISFEIRQLDAWGNNEDGYEINESWHMGEMTTKAQNERKAFTSWLKNHCGISFKNNRTLIEFDGDCYTIIDRKTKEPLFIAIPQY